jgi:hypothetical protein
VSVDSSAGIRGRHGELELRHGAGGGRGGSAQGRGGDGGAGACTGAGGVASGSDAAGWAQRAGVVVRAAASETVAGVEAKGPPPGGVVRGVLFDMDGVLCDSEHCSRKAGVEMFAEMGYTVAEEDFIPFMGTGTWPGLVNSWAGR